MRTNWTEERVRAVTVAAAKRRSARHAEKPPTWGITALLLLAAASALTSCAGDGDASANSPRQQSSAATVDWHAVDEAMGRSGKLQDDSAYKFSMPRTDLHVAVNGVTIKPALALGSWLAMKPEGIGVIAMGDLVLTEDEVNPVIARLQDAGTMQTALHNHLLHENPRVMYLHIHGEGDPVQIARAVRGALGLTRTPAPAPAAEAVQPLSLDTAGINRALGRSGKASGGVYHVTVPRAEVIHVNGVEIPPSMGVAIAVNFQPTGAGTAAINGDFVMAAGEVNEVVKALQQGGIQVVALHNHMLAEEPRLFFMHYWANDDAVKLARTLRAALDHVATKPAADSSGG